MVIDNMRVRRCLTRAINKDILSSVPSFVCIYVDLAGHERSLSSSKLQWRLRACQRVWSTSCVTRSLFTYTCHFCALELRGLPQTPMCGLTSLHARKKCLRPCDGMLLPRDTLYARAVRPFCPSPNGMSQLVADCVENSLIINMFWSFDL